MIDHKQLRIGNLIGMNLAEFPQNYLQVMEVAKEAMKVTDDWKSQFLEIQGHDYYDAEDLEPIPLTNEWLILFGFQKLERGPYVDADAYQIGEDAGRIIWCANDVFVPSSDDSFIRITKPHGYPRPVICEYVHQLMNIYFTLTLKELQLK